MSTPNDPGPDLMSCDYWKAALAKMPPGARISLIMGNDPPDNLAIELCAIGPVDTACGIPLAAEAFGIVLAIIDVEDDVEADVGEVEDEEDET